ncbi:MBL fold metallo-hydrolase [Paenibacillus athensensis]|uniref:Metal-binding protein n=1 Tax=Paenibacillus athensensis TaxID=1967502 RepID=A0A4Y8Q060_9BACL|nr:MBL fold metallo-hydrolase [Paenibacillus athensensis]MCD1261100.1 MBL fold metallo-hydrolase [Paenibacillus athensensis]
MIKIDTIPLGDLGTNCYLLSDPERKKGIIIDPGVNPKPLLKRIADLDIEAILLTHAHFDHIGGVEEVRKLKRCPVYLHDLEADWLGNPRKNGSAYWPQLGGPVTASPAEYALDEGQVLELLGIKLKVFHTPGHSPGSVSFLYDKHLFSGDVLFRLSVGRTDLGGNQHDLMTSIHDKLFPLGDEVVVYPGHGVRTKIGYERENNPYV